MHCKSYSHFFSKNFQHICVSLDVNFNESLTNDIVSFEQLGPGYHHARTTDAYGCTSKGPFGWQCSVIEKRIRAFGKRVFGIPQHISKTRYQVVKWTYKHPKPDPIAQSVAPLNADPGIASSTPSSAT